MSKYLKLVMLDEINDNTILVKFIDRNGMLHSIGKIVADKLQYRFPIQLLSYYQKCEGISSDPSEGNTRIHFGEGKGSGNVATCNDSLISCWSVCTTPNNPWESLADSSFAKDKLARPYALLTTVGAVKKQIRIIIDEINKKCRDANGLLIMNAIYGLVSYYPIEGVPLELWKTKDNIEKGIDVTTIQNIFHKPVQNNFGQRYDVEKECRFALILNVRSFKDRDGNLVSSDQMASQLIYIPLIVESQLHYIEKVYIHVPSHGSCEEIPLIDVLTKTEIA